MREPKTLPAPSPLAIQLQRAVRRLVERGAVYFVWHAAALGMMTELARLLADVPSAWLLDNGAGPQASTS